MSEHDAIRASDSDRERTGQALRDHYAQGRLNADELSTRLDGVYAATTLGELNRLTADLPRLPASPSARRSELALHRAELRRELIQRAGASISPFVLCTVIWAATGAHRGEFWPAWLLVFPVLFLARNLWRLYGPAPDTDAVRRELHGGRRRRHGRAGSA